MQSSGFPIYRDQLLQKANEMHRNINGCIRPVGFLKIAWLNRVLKRHPGISLRSTQPIARHRNEASFSSIGGFFYRLVQHVIERSIGPGRIFNADETGFEQNSNSRNVLAIRGSTNIWKHKTELSFHLTIMACGSASGFVVPPLFIIPGKRLSKDVLDERIVPGSCVTVGPKGFMSAKLFARWIEHFASSVPDHIERPLVLVYDGCASHFSEHIINVALENGIILANSTHLIQPMDVAVFKPFKSALQNAVQEFVIDKGETTLTKKSAIGLASKAWIRGIENRSANIVSGFAATGIFPPDLTRMTEKWIKFRRSQASSMADSERISA